MQLNRLSVVSTTESMYDYPRSVQQAVFSSPRNSELPDLATEYGHCIMQGVLYKKEKFMMWTKMMCMIRNSFLECHKAHSTTTTSDPALKLFLLGSNVIPENDGKRQWAFRLKHPRRGGVLHFAAENETGFKQWMSALQASTSIEVRSVLNVDEIRINDSDMQRRWTSLERGHSQLSLSEVRVCVCVCVGAL